MYLTRLRPRKRAFESPAFWQAMDHEYSLHRAVWQMFGDHPGRQRDFLFRQEGNRRDACLWTLSERPPEADTRAWQAESRALEPALEPGDRLAFDLRVNPVISRGGKRYDVVMDLKTSLGWKGKKKEDRDSEATLVQQALEQWAERRQERLGVQFHQLQADGYTSRRFAKPRQDKRIQISTCELSGVLEVKDPQRFLNAWAAGIGPAKSFGCGLMLIRRAPR